MKFLKSHAVNAARTKGLFKVKMELDEGCSCQHWARRPRSSLNPGQRHAVAFKLDSKKAAKLITQMQGLSF